MAKSFSSQSAPLSESGQKNATISHSKPEPSRNDGEVSPVLGYFCAVAAVGVATGILWLLHPYLDPGSESLVYLPVVIACALKFGFGSAVFASILSICCWDYFFDVPYFALTMHRDHDVISLIVYLAVAVTSANLAARAKQQARISAVLEERNRLARDVHDTLSHAFTGIKFLLEAASRIDSPEETANCLVQARNLAIEGAQEARRSVLALRPAALEEAGNLVNALKKLAEQKNSDSLIAVTFAVHGEQRAISEEVEENLLRICQESLANALKHSMATKINLAVSFSASMLQTTVEDNGRGFDKANVSRGFGLTSMQERAAVIGGKLTIGPSLRGGTKVVARVPLSKQ